MLLHILTHPPRLGTDLAALGDLLDKRVDHVIGFVIEHLQQPEKSFVKRSFVKR